LVLPTIALLAKRSKADAVSFKVIETTEEHRLRELILAGALAEAQIELTNPEKSITGTLSANPARRAAPFAMRRSQAASTSCAKCAPRAAENLHRPDVFRRHATMGDRR
jgi:hypothetical protein